MHFSIRCRERNNKLFFSSRNKEIRWKEFFKSLAEFFGCMFTMHFIFARIIIPKYSSFGGQMPSFAQTIYLIIHMAVPIMGLGLSLHYVVLHSWQNAISELLRFADREFYKVCLQVFFYVDKNIFLKMILFFRTGGILELGASTIATGTKSFMIGSMSMFTRICTKK